MYGLDRAICSTRAKVLPRGRGCRTSGTTGMIVGGAAGALLGRSLDGGRDKTTGTVLGAGAGALLGHEVGKKSNC